MARAGADFDRPDHLPAVIRAYGLTGYVRQGAQVDHHSVLPQPSVIRLARAGAEIAVPDYLPAVVDVEGNDLSWKYETYGWQAEM